MSYRQTRSEPESAPVFCVYWELILRPDHIQEADSPPEWAYFRVWMDIRSELERCSPSKLWIDPLT
jgi:hypothetical protein